MAVNRSRSMNAELEQGLIDGRYMQLAPNWSLTANLPTERLDWPTYEQVEQHKYSNVREVPSVDNRIVKVARHRHAIERSQRGVDAESHIFVDRGAYTISTPEASKQTPFGDWA